MTRTYEEFDEARAIRLDTLEIVAAVDQQQSEWRPADDRWSVGEVLDHLWKLDDVVVRELALTLERSQRGLPFVYRSLADVETSIPSILRPILPFFEIPFSLFNSVLPQSFRRSLTGNRSIPLQAPRVIRPRFGRPIAELREDLRATFDRLEEQQAEHPDVDLDRVYYYNPITGLDTAAGMYKFISNHEERHQGQLRDLVDDPSFPRAS